MQAQTTDPFAAIARPMPLQPAAPSSSPPSSPAAAPGADPFAAIAQPASGTPPPATGEMRASEGLGTFTEKWLSGTSEEQARGWGGGPGSALAGAVKSAAQPVATLLDIFSQSPKQFIEGYKVRNPQATDQEALAAYQNTLGHHAKSAVNWLRQGSEPDGFWEHVGAIGEQALEWMGGEELLKLAGAGIKATQVGGRALEAADKLKGATQLAATLKANPKLAGMVAIGLKASGDAAAVGAQTYAHTEDPTQAAMAAAMGGGLSAVMGGGQSYLESIAPKKIAIGGVETPALASQVNEAGRPLDTGAKGAPAIARAQQEAGQQVIQNTAARATANALNEINKTRPVFAATENPARMLPAPEGSVGEPFKFRLEGPGATEETEGPLFQSPRKKQIGTKVIERAEGPANMPQTVNYEAAQRPTAQGANVREINPETGEGPALEEGKPISTNARRLVKEPQFQYMSGSRPGSPEPRGDVARGGGTLETTDPREAESWLRAHEDFQATPEHARLPQAQQDAIEAQRKGLQEQLGLYYSSPYHQRFAPADVAGAVGQVRTFGDAADQVEAVAQPVYQTLDRVSGGEFNKAKEAAKQAQGVLQRSQTMEAYETAQTRLHEANQKIADLIDRHRGDVNFQDYMTAKNAWRHASRMNELHAIFEGMANGVTVDETDQGLTRVVTGKAKNLQNYLADDSTREQIEQLIGKDGVLNLKQISLLLAKANTARQTTNLLSHVGDTLSVNIQGGGWVTAGSALAGHFIARGLGGSGWEGAVTGAAAARAVLHIAATNPKVGNMVDYAVRNGISVQRAAPLIARTIAAAFEKPQQPEDEEGAQQ